ncbi:MAG: hypothetical protein K1X78_27230 [Verrucomicrobiaceae bacterium]|nr:hypothetical protein [Verrucomicrobiaceae bacterium]
MQQTWNIRSRSPQCALSGRSFADGEPLYTAIYFDAETGGYVRRDIALDAWEQELTERTPFSFWKTSYEAAPVEEKPEIAPKENAQALLARLIEEDDPKTENARYILALMLERKRQLTPTDVKETEHGRMLIYENKKTGDVFMVRDPELHLGEIEQVQEEVAMLLGFGGPAAEAAKAVGMSFSADGTLQPAAPSASQAVIASSGEA